MINNLPLPPTPLTRKQKLIYFLWVLVYSSSFTVSIFGCAADHWPSYAIFKYMFMPAVSFIFYMLWHNHSYTKQYYLLQTAFLFAWVGDILLTLTKVHHLCFILGACFFLVQHNLYIWLNLSTKTKEKSLWKAPYWGFPNMAYVLTFCLNYYAKVDTLERTECLIYSFFLATAFYTSFYRDSTNRVKYWLTIVGFAFYVCSDMLIAIDKFWFQLSSVQGSSILLTYYIAQTLICHGNLPDTIPQP